MKQKVLPYRETDEYVSNLVERATEHAISKQTRKRPLLRKYLIAATVALLLAGAGVTYYQMAPVRRQLAAQQQKSPVDDFLNSITDDEAKLLPYYEIEEIPEY